MTTENIRTNIMDDARQAMKQAKERTENITGIKRVCADVSISHNEAGELHVVVSWTCTDGTYVKPKIQDGIYAGYLLNDLADVWECEHDPEVVQKACRNSIAEVMFYEKTGVSKQGKPFAMQEFRIPNAIDRGNANHEKIVEHTNEIVRRDIEYRAMCEAKKNESEV